MGKRGAVRTTNSGLPVDHSGPGLRVGPTTPATADRKSEACPPGLDCMDVGFGAGVGFGFAVGVAGALSQEKSGREPESRALSGASKASDVLRSAARRSGVRGEAPIITCKGANKCSQLPIRCQRP
jgi:hypothetical protein